MSADPFVQSPGNMQSYNRYAYVLNNPLTLTDPSGYWSLKKFAKASFKALRSPTLRNAFNVIAAQPGQAAVDRYIMNHRWAMTAGKIVTSMATAAVCGGCGGVFFSSYYAYQATGSTTEAVKTGIIAYATNAAFYGVGSATQALAQSGSGALATGAFNAAGHAAVGCASAAASGGSCRDGALGRCSHGKNSL